MQKTRSFPLVLRLGLIVGVLLATLSVGNTLLVRSSKAAFANASSPIENASETRDYWTKERMNSALAESMPQASTPSSTRPNTTTLAYSKDATTTKATATLATPVPNSLYNQFPASVVGKLFYYSPGENKDAVCSGTAMTSNNKSVVDTAGHCLYSYGAWSTNLLFCPQFGINGGFDGSPGCWYGYQSYAPQSWLDDQHNFTHDFGLLVVHPDTQNTYTYLTDGVGGAGYAINLPLPTLLSLTATAYGYPKLDPFDGMEMISATGNLTTVDFTYGTMLRMSNNDMTAGSSGGPWFVTYEGIIYLIGHEDTHNYTLATSSSPFYGDEWLNLFNIAQNVPNA